MGDRIIYDYKLKVLSPIHIGNGEELAPVDYCKINNNVYVIDSDKLFEDNRFDEEKFIEQVRRYRDFHWDKFNTSLPQEYDKYRMKVSVPKKSANDIGNIFAFMKTGGKPFIPGTSLKGAIRTIILKVLVSQLPDEKFKKALISGKKKANNPKEVGRILNKKIFGSDPTTDIMKGIQVSDSTKVDANKLKIYPIKTIKQKKYEYEVKFWANHGEFLSCETEVEGNIVIDWGKISNALKEEKVSKYFSEAEMKKYLRYIEENILEIIKEMGQLRTENEINYFDKYADGRFDSIVEFYQKLQKKEKPLIRLGRFSGYMDKSLGDEIKALDKNLLMSIVRDYYRKYSPRDFPVTRLLLKKERNNKEEFSYPPGWAEMELSKKRTAELD